MAMATARMRAGRVAALVATAAPLIIHGANGDDGSSHWQPGLTDDDRSDDGDGDRDGPSGLTDDGRSNDGDGDGDGPPCLTDDDLWNNSDSEDEPFRGRVRLPVVWRLDLDLLHVPCASVGRTDFVLLPMGSGYKGEGEVLSSHAAWWRTGVTALFPVDVESD
jgi:hypothetical protein